MSNLKDRARSDRIHAMVYGESGAGKTHLLGTFPNPFILDTDYGLESLRGRDIDYEEFYTTIEDDDAKDRWPALLETVEVFTKNPTHETLSVDSLTTTCDVVVAHVLAKNRRVALQLQDYNEIFNELTKLLVRLRRCPTHAILTAHEETIRDEHTGKLSIRPMAIGQAFPKKLPIFFNNIFCALVETPKRSSVGTLPVRSLLVSSDGTRIAKTQASNDDTHIDKSFEAITEHFNKVE